MQIDMPVPTPPQQWMNPEHRQVEAITPDGQRVEVDEHMLPILTRLWDRGITTQFSCEGKGQGRMYLTCTHLTSGVRLLRIILGMQEPMNALTVEATRQLQRHGQHPATPLPRPDHWSGVASVSLWPEKMLDPAWDSITFRCPRSWVPLLADAIDTADPLDEAAEQQLQQISATWAEHLRVHRDMISNNPRLQIHALGDGRFCVGG